MLVLCISKALMMELLITISSQFSMKFMKAGTTITLTLLSYTAIIESMGQVKELAM